MRVISRLHLCPPFQGVSFVSSSGHPVHAPDQRPRGTRHRPHQSRPRPGWVQVAIVADQTALTTGFCRTQTVVSAAPVPDPRHVHTGPRLGPLLVKIKPVPGSGHINAHRPWLRSSKHASVCTRAPSPHTGRAPQVVPTCSASSRSIARECTRPLVATHRPPSSTSPDSTPLFLTICAAYERLPLLRPTELAPRRLGMHLLGKY